jgi:hypothetical protein
MPSRFSWRKRIIPGVRLNASRSGLSLTLGPRGARITIGRRGLSQTVGIPGTGLYWRRTYGGSQRTRGAAHGPAPTGVVRDANAPPPVNLNLAGCLVALAVVGLGVAGIATSGLTLIPAALLFIGWGWYRRGQPDQAARRLIKRARSQPPTEAVRLLRQALEIDPRGAATTLDCAQWFFAHECWADAVDAYTKYLIHPHGSQAAFSYARALVRAGHLEDAIAELQNLRSSPEAPEETRLSATAELAMAFYLKGEGSQGLAIVSTAPLQRRNLTPSLGQCLFARAIGRYLVGQARQAISDLERLYAVSTQPDLQNQILEIKAKMLSGTFVLDEPKPYPDWYPTPLDLGGDAPGEQVGAGTVDAVIDHPSLDQEQRSEEVKLIPTNVSGGESSQPVPGPTTSVAASADDPPHADAAPDGPAVVSSSSDLTRSPAAAPVDVPEATAQSVGGDPGRPASEPSPGPITSTSSGEPATAPAASAPPQLSPDGRWWWTGTEWVPAISGDGRYRWNGTQWELVEATEALERREET